MITLHYWIPDLQYYIFCFSLLAPYWLFKLASHRLFINPCSYSWGSHYDFYSDHISCLELELCIDILSIQLPWRSSVTWWLWRLLLTPLLSSIVYLAENKHFQELSKTRVIINNPLIFKLSITAVCAKITLLLTTFNRIALDFMEVKLYKEMKTSKNQNR